ncbi:MAG: amino acid ABC transporter substrate-binding protein, partial [Chitinophagaceae bacterium]|nr:amino acid ABC transporter substrate-binding protein [Chitinophagaceae bacterium]
MNKKPGILVAFLLCAFISKSSAQDSQAVRYQVAVFTPMYLDSAFDITSTYKYGKSFPKFINPGLEFYEGAELAI